MVRFRQFSKILLRRIVVAAVLMAAIAAWPGHSTAVAGSADLWKVDTVEGTAWVQRSGAGWRPLAAGAELGPGSRVKTGKDGRIVISRPGDRVSVSPNSRFGIPAPARNGPVTHIMQNLGTLLFKIRTRASNPFNVRTPYLAATIRGTTFTVSVDDSNAALHVATGAVEVTSILSGETALVGPGETAIIDSRTGGRMKLVGANGRKPGKKTNNKTGAAGKTGKTGKAASAVQQTGNTEARGTTGAPEGGARSAVKPASTGPVIRRAIGAGRIDLFKLTRGLVNRAEAGRNRARKKSQRKRAVGSKADTGSSTTLERTDSATASSTDSSGVDNSGSGSVGSGSPVSADAPVDAQAAAQQAASDARETMQDTASVAREAMQEAVSAAREVKKAASAATKKDVN